MMHPDFDGSLYHATSARNAEKILSEGLAPGSFLATGDIADYYLETVKDEGEKAVLLKIDASDIYSYKLGPDMPGLEEPISTVVGLKEEDIWNYWEKSEKTWETCFCLIGSVQSLERIPPEKISIED